MNEPHGPTPHPYDPTQFAPMNRPMPPPGGPLPPWPPGPPPRGNRRLVWLLVGLVTLLTVAAVVLTMTLVGRDRHENAHSAAGTGDTAPVAVSALEGLLPAKDVVSAAASDPGLGLVDEGAGIDLAVMVDADCQGLTSVSGPIYAGSGWTAARWQKWNSPADPDPPQLVQQILMSVATYPQAEAARAFYARQSAAWKKCSGRVINSRMPSVKDSTDQFWSVGAITDADGALKATTISEGGGGWSCQDIMTVRNNVVVQTNVCALKDSAAAAQTLIDSITAKIDAAA